MASCADAVGLFVTKLIIDINNFSDDLDATHCVVTSIVEVFTIKGGSLGNNIVLEGDAVTTFDNILQVITDLFL